MTQRLVWNFEFSSPKKIDLQIKETENHEDLKWEARFFWPEKEIISLSIIDDSLLDLGNYEQKHKKDHYYLIPGHNYNIKNRRNELLFKPLLKQSKYAYGFGTKINLDTPEAQTNFIQINSLDLQKIKQQALEEGTEVLVKKESFTYKFNSQPTIKLELARIEIAKQVYFSACIEGKSLNLVETITKGLLGKRISCDYVTFLKNSTQLQ